MLREERNAINAANAVAVMKAAGWTPLAPYVNSNTPWLAMHLCGEKHTPRYSNVQQGHLGCRSCAHKGVRQGGRRVDPEIAVAVMRAAGLEPTSDYPGNRKPWPSTHTCGRIVRPRLDSVRLGQGGCWICASRKYVRELPGCVYLLQSNHNHPSFPSPVVKAGVTNGATWNRKPAWTLLAEFHFDDGTIPLAIERGIITWLNGELGLEPTPSTTNLTTKGFAEAFAVADLARAGVSVPDVIDKFIAIIKAVPS
ncbi:MAG: hypothetical protein ACYC1I_11190 [Acidimicrobiales bacterium]